VEFFGGWKPLSPLQLAVEEVMWNSLNEASIYRSSWLRRNHKGATP
ncbi:hypothetical protein Tco_1306757, partial [Tanacetum coccineum]